MSLTFDYGRDYGRDYGMPPFPVMELTIIGRQPDQAVTATGLVDSGADATLIPLDILKSISARQRDGGWIRTVSSQRYSISLYAVTIQIRTTITQLFHPQSRHYFWRKTDRKDNIGLLCISSVQNSSSLTSGSCL